MMPIKNGYFIILILFLISPGSSFGQLGSWQFKNYSIEDDLPNNAISSIIQDSLEYIWIGTENGLSRYNGVDFHNYFNEIDDSTSLPGNSVNKLYVDSKNRLLIGTSDGFCLYNLKHDNFYRIFSDGRIAVRDIIEDHQGIIWVATEGSGLLKFSNDLKLLKQYNKSNSANRILDNYIWRLFEEDNLVWIGTLDGRLIYFDKKTETFSQVEEYGHNNGHITAINKDNDNNLIILSDDAGLAKIIRTDNSKGKYKVIRYEKVNFRLMTMIKRPNGEFWLSHLGGLLVFNSGKNLFYSLHEDPRYAGLDSGFGAISIFIDKQQNIWLGGANNGIAFISNSYKQFYNCVNPEFQSSVVSEIIINSSNQLIAGTGDDGIFVKDPNQNAFIQSNAFNLFTKSTVEKSCVYKIIETSKNNYLVATYRGLFLYNSLTNKIEYYHIGYGVQDGLNNNHVNDILKIDKNIYWLATNGGGINTLNLKSREFGYITKENEERTDSSLISNYCITFLKDHIGNIWIGTYNGLSIFDPLKKQFQNFLHVKNDSNSLSHNWVYCIYEDSEKRIWIGTPSGLNLYIPETKKFRVFDKNTGLADNLINGIVEDNNKQLWISTGKGISKISLADYTCKSFNKDDGIKILQFSRGAIYKDQAGNIFMGGKGGILAFHPDSIRYNPNFPSVQITSIRILNKEVTSVSAPDILPEEIVCLNEIKIPYNQNVITLEFTAFNYINAYKNAYAYKLEGFDKNWQYINYKREVTYTNLNPGEYLFRVKASNNDGVWNENGDTLRIVILPPWWKTLFFKIFILFSVAGISLGSYFYRINNLKKQKVHLESLIKVRTREVEEKNTELVQQTEELNAINTILEEHQQYIEKQAEELRVNSENLQKANKQLIEKQEMILSQAENLKETNQKLTVLNATKDKFFSIIAHDLKNPFNSILGFSEVLLVEFKGLTEEKKQLFIEHIHESSKRIYKLLDNLLQWARTQTGNTRFKPEVFSLSEAIDSNYDLVIDTLKEKEIKLIKELPENTDVLADRNMIDTVIRNLLGNAIKFTEKGEISTHIKVNEEYLEISITDSGVGISENVLNRIFEIDQVKSTKGTRGEQGSGLGLLICKEFVQINGGDITVKSIKGKGTTFTFTVPRSK
jgi:signal transduction histidine kinase/ligand-binding sensor domain-containing protein